MADSFEVECYDGEVLNVVTKETHESVVSERDHLIEVIILADNALAWIAEHAPSAVEAMPRDIYKGLLRARDIAKETIHEDVR